MLKVLAINCGSSTLKFRLIHFKDKDSIPVKGMQIVSGIVDHVGGQGSIKVAGANGKQYQESVTVADHGAAMRLVLEKLGSQGILGCEKIQAVGHRVVHGGEQLIKSTLINDEILNRIEALDDLAPLHNPLSLSAIKAARIILGASVPQVLTFDTAFHHSLPEWAARYAIPIGISEKYHIRRYGFHGLAHRYMMERFCAVTSTPLDQVRLITLQLGNGCSATAIKNGFSVDTSMGFTPLEGLIMGTRSGDLDPSLAGFLMKQEGVRIDDIENLLNKQSGLLGISGRSYDMRELLKAEELGDRRSSLAVAMFCYRVRKYIGAYMAALNGAQAIVFGGGVGENAPGVRARICEGMGWCGLFLDPDINARTIGTEGRISRDGAEIHVYVIPVDEEIIIASETARVLLSQK